LKNHNGKNLNGGASQYRFSMTHNDTANSVQKRLLLAVHQGFSTRYLLQTDILTTLQTLGANITVLMQSESEPLRRRLEDTGVTVDSIPVDETATFMSSSKMQSALRFIRHYVHAGFVQTSEDHYQIAVRNAWSSNAGIKTKLYYRFLRLIILVARRSKILRTTILNFETSRFLANGFTDAIKKHSPDLVVTTSLGTFNYDQFVMRAAKRAGIPVSTVVLSWDNTTSLGYPGGHADHVIAWTTAMKKELVEFNDISAEKIDVGGIAHWDIYYRDDPSFDRTAFKRSLNLNPEKRTILVATKSPAAYAYNPNLAKVLAEAIQNGILPDDCEILIRIHPLHYRFKNGQAVYQPLLDLYRQLAQDFPEIVLNEPDIQTASLDYDMAEEEVVGISRLLRCTDVLVNIFSTMNIEGAIFDVPLVNVSFEEEELLYDTKLTGRFDIMIDWRATHNQRLMALDGCRTVWNSTELVQTVAEYLMNPSLDREGRKRIATQEGSCHAGFAGNYIGKRLFQLASTDADRHIN
jgi:hypothetical protein